MDTQTILCPTSVIRKPSFFPPDQEDFYQISPGSVVKTLGSTDEKYETPDIFRIKYFYGFWTSDQLP